MNILRRVFHGRVAKSPRNRHPAAVQTTVNQSAISISEGLPSRHEPDLGDDVRIKQEDEEHDSLMDPEEDFSNDMDISQQEIGQDTEQGHMEEEYSQGDTELESDVGSVNDVSEDDGNEELDEDDDWDEEASEDSQAPPGNDETPSPSKSLSSDEPIPSIEEDGPVEPYRRKIISPYLHGKSKKDMRAKPTSLPDEAEDEYIDEDFEAELAGEQEDGLLVHEDDLRDYLRHKRATPGADKWPVEACRLYKLLYLRGLYPLMPSDWAWPLNRLQPMPAQLFMPTESNDKALIRAEKSAYHAEKALRRLFELFVRISGYRLCDQHALAAPLITKEIKTFVKWAEMDVGFFKKLDYVSPVFVISYKNAQAASSGQTIVDKCQSTVQQYRDEYARKGIENYPRMIYVFVVVQHVVLVMAADTTEREVEEEPFPFAELDISNKTHWLDYSLGISIPVMLARQSLVAHRRFFSEVEVVESDPDA